MEFWATVLVPFLVGAVTVLLVVLWWVLRARSLSPTSFGVVSERSRRCREPMGFGGHAEGFREWLFAVEEAIRTLKPEDPVGYAASFLEGNARKWLVSSWGSDGRLRPNSWPEFRAQLSRAFAEEDAEEWYRLRLIRTRQSAGAGIEEYISEFASCCLMVPKLDELTKVTLFIEGLFDTEIQKEVRRDHPKSLSEAARVARTASLNAEGSKKVLEEQPRAFAAQRSRPGQLSRSERLFLFRRGLCFKCRKPGHTAANCPSSRSVSSEAPNGSHQ